MARAACNTSFFCRRNFSASPANKASCIKLNHLHKQEPKAMKHAGDYIYNTWPKRMSYKIIYINSSCLCNNISSKISAKLNQREKKIHSRDSQSVSWLRPVQSIDHHKVLLYVTNNCPSKTLVKFHYKMSDFPIAAYNLYGCFILQ